MRSAIVFACAALASTLLASPASATPATPAQPPPPTSVTVPLITGDRVTVTTDAAGKASFSVLTAPRKGRPAPRFESYSDGDSMYVVPDDAATYLQSGRLDKTLFDVSYLMREGFAGAATLPVIVEHSGDAPGATVTRELESISATAVTVHDGAQFWPALAGGQVSKVWLDRPVHVTLDRSVAKVGAPAAWQAGFDGTGATIAVLDTGIDLDHPDFAGRIAATRDFSGKGTVQDGHFHGTHVASIAAGRGTASGGKYTGVAPGARLVIGKVLSDEGSGDTSQIIDGMEWAAASGAKVINMSLGGDPGPEGGDPLANALDRISASTGVLFVVAAGNNGREEPPTVDSPGIATSALTVAAVDSNDAYATFSSRGPLPYQRVLKPDLTAPGVAIAAARAAGTDHPGATPVDDRYTRASGTSMATPHVAGAAAILAGQHPEWTGQQLKAALMSSGANLGFSPFVQGAGRLDVARAVRQQVAATGDLDFGRGGENTPIDKTITYTNHSSTPLTLRLTPTISGTVPQGTISAPAEVTVPAGGSAPVTVRLSPAALVFGTYTGALVAQLADETVRTPLGFIRGKTTVPVRVDVLGRAGQPCGGLTQTCRAGFIKAFNLDNPDESVTNDRVPDTGSLTLRLVPGRYRIFASVSWFSPDDLRPQAAFLVRAEVRADGALTMVLDARQAQPIEVSTGRPSEPYEGAMTLHRPYPPPDQRPPGAIYFPLAAWLATYGNVSFWATPTDSSTAGGWLLTTQQSRGAPLASIKIAGGGPALHVSYFNYPWTADPAEDPRFAGQFTAPLIDVGSTLPGKLDALRGKLILLSRTDWTQTCDATPEELTAAAQAGIRGIILFATQDLCPYFPLSATSMPGGVPIVSIPVAEGQSLRDLVKRRPVSLRVSGTPISPYLYDLKFYERAAIPAKLSYRVSDSALARVPARFHADKPTVTRRHTAFFWGPDEPSTWVNDVLAIAPMRREELIGPLPQGQIWRRAVGYWDGYRQFTWDALRRGEQQTQHWFAAPQIPGAELFDQNPVACTLCRQTDTLYFAPGFTNPTENVSTGWQSLPAEVKLYAGNTEIAGKLYKGVYPSFVVPTGSTRLRLHHDWTNSSQETLYGSRVKTTWEFDSRRPDRSNNTGSRCLAAAWDGDTSPCSVQPLMFLRYDANLDDSNRIHRAPSLLRISAYHQDSTDKPSQLTSMRVRASFDDGNSWQPVLAMWGWGAERTVILPMPPPGANTVSLRVEAAERSESTVVQEITRAFGIGRW
jgi:subtilisin family serine protease